MLGRDILFSHEAVFRKEGMIVSSNTVMITTTDQRPRMGTLVMKRTRSRTTTKRTP
jgi:hypothetical protein